MRAVNNVGYTALCVVMVPVQVTLELITLALMFLVTLVRLLNAASNWFLFWLMPEEIKLKLVQAREKGRV